MHPGQFRFEGVCQEEQSVSDDDVVVSGANDANDEDGVSSTCKSEDSHHRLMECDMPMGDTFEQWCYSEHGQTAVAGELPKTSFHEEERDAAEKQHE